MPDDHHQEWFEGELEDRYSWLLALVNGLGVVFSFVDKDRIYRFNNDDYERWFSDEPMNLYGKHIRNGPLGEEGYKIVKPFVDKALAGERVEYEAKVPYKDGRELRWVHVIYDPYFQNEEVVGFFVMVMDITEEVVGITSHMKEINVILNRAAQVSEAMRYDRRHKSERSAARNRQECRSDSSNFGNGLPETG